MRFLVTIDGSDMAVGRPPEQLAKVVEQMVVPSVEQLAQWEQEGRIYGGGYTAARGGVFIMDADSSEGIPLPCSACSLSNLSQYLISRVVRR